MLPGWGCCRACNDIRQTTSDECHYTTPLVDQATQWELSSTPLGHVFAMHSSRTRVSQSLKWLEMLKDECDRFEIDHGLDEAIKDVDRLYSRLDFCQEGSLQNNTSGMQVFEDLGLATQFRNAMQESGFTSYTEKHPLLVNNQMQHPFTWDNMVGSLRDVVAVRWGDVKGIW
ncbi:unnamed protein product [Amoebophrya sp. A120]|nr:unnamed protein product [Amoebophrya sp. A120]|eukprot:GSA120T00024887001.1